MHQETIFNKGKTKHSLDPHHTPCGLLGLIDFCFDAGCAEKLKEKRLQFRMQQSENRSELVYWSWNCLSSSAILGFLLVCSLLPSVTTKELGSRHSLGL
jgi:hypothetical protein